MEQIPKSGTYYANKFARIALKAYEEVMGKNVLNAIFNLASLSSLIDNYPLTILNASSSLPTSRPFTLPWRRCRVRAADGGRRCEPDAPLSMMP
jgi:hypothetical protein